jgi:ParB family chromosome partitioning protein
MIHVGFISTLGRMRDVDPAQVKTLAESIKEVGLLNPITVYKREIIRNGQAADGYGLVAGAHRLEACKSLGWQEVPAQVVDLDDDDRIIAECDENLCGSRLTPAEKAEFTRARKEAYLRKHPETAAGVAQANGMNRKLGNNVADNLSATSFDNDQAEKTGVDPRTVRRNADRGEKITPAALAMVKGTKLDTGEFLDRLKKVKPENQCEYVQRELDAARKPKPKAAAPHAPDPHDDYSVREKQVTALMNAWNKAGKEARENFLDRIGAAL